MTVECCWESGREVRVQSCGYCSMTDGDVFDDDDKTEPAATL